MAKRDPKKAKAKGGKKATKKPLRKKPPKEGAVLAELELRDEQLESVSGGVTLPRTLPTLSSPTLNAPTLETTPNLTGGENLKDALNLGLY